MRSAEDTRHKPIITGLGLITPLGGTAVSFWDGLQGKKKVLPVRKKFLTHRGEKEIGIFIADTDGIDAVIPARNRRRMEPFVQMGVLACHRALRDAAISVSADKRIGIVFGSAYGCMNASFSFQDSIIDYGDACPSPTHFVNSVNNTPASQISMSLDIQGPCISVSCFEMTTASVMQCAWNLLETDMADVVLACIGEENGDIRQYATATYVSDTPMDSINPSEAITCFILEREQQKTRYGTLSDIVMGRGQEYRHLLNSISAVIVSGREKKTVIETRPPFFNYTSTYGCLPSGDALALALAALSLKEGVLPCGSLTFEPGEILGCSHGSGDFTSLITLKR